MGAVRSKVRLYDLAKDLKVDIKRLITEVRAHGIDVSVPQTPFLRNLPPKSGISTFRRRLIKLSALLSLSIVGGMTAFQQTFPLTWDRRDQRSGRFNSRGLCQDQKQKIQSTKRRRLGEQQIPWRLISMTKQRVACE